MNAFRARFGEFIASEAAGGIVLMAAAALALLAANLPAVSGLYFDALALETGPVLAPAHGPMTVHAWINAAQKWTADDLFAAAIALHWADRALKETGKTTEEGILQSAILAMCQTKGRRAA